MTLRLHSWRAVSGVGLGSMLHSTSRCMQWRNVRVIYLAGTVPSVLTKRCRNQRLSVVVPARARCTSTSVTSAIATTVTGSHMAALVAAVAVQVIQSLFFMVNWGFDI